MVGKHGHLNFRTLQVHHDYVKHDLNMMKQVHHDYDIGLLQWRSQFVFLTGANFLNPIRLDL